MISSFELKKIINEQIGKNKPAIVRVKTEERGAELVAMCNQKGWQVIVGIEPDKEENISDINKLEAGLKRLFNFQWPTSKNAPCPCGSGKQYKRCCGK
ncbi:MAG: SEC-C metal-binding domain-containing protein [Ginsengibacter sp.]